MSPECCSLTNRLPVSMWALIHQLRQTGVTVILTTHYIEEAEEMADRVGVINKGKLMLVEDKVALMGKLGRKRLTLTVSEPIAKLPAALEPYDLELSEDQRELIYTYDTQASNTGIERLLNDLKAAGLVLA